MDSRLSLRPVAAAILATLVFFVLAAGASAAGWHDEGQLSAPGDLAGDEVAAAAPDGSTWVLWSTENKLQIERIAADGAKGPVKDVAGSDPTALNLVVESNGDALAAWVDSGSGVFVREVDPAGVLGDEHRVGDSNATGPLALGIDGNDVATIVYGEPGSVTFDNLLWADRVDSTGVPAGSPIQISTNENDAAGNTAIAVNASGDAVISWGAGNITTSFPNPAAHRGIRRLAADGTLGTEHALGDLQLSSDDGTAPAIGSNGDAYVLYDQLSPSGGEQGDMKLAKLDAGDTLSAVATLGTNAWGGVPGEGLVENSAGDLTAIWERPDMSSSDELVSRRVLSDGTAVPPLSSDPDLLTPADQVFEGSWSLAAMPGGKAVAAWSAEDFSSTTTTTLRSSVIDPTSGPAAPQTVVGPTTDEDGGLSIAPGAAGDMYLAYDLTPDSFNTLTVQGAYYDVQGPTVDQFAAPAAGTAGDEIVFGAHATDRSGVEGYAWDFGDGSSATGAIADHTYPAPGTYTVKLTATDSEANTTVRTRSLTVRSANSGSGNGGGSTGTPGTTDTKPRAGALVAKLAGLHHTLRLGRHHTLTLHLPAQQQDAFGSLTVRTSLGGAHVARLITIGKRDFPIRHDQKVTVRVKVTSRAIKLAKRHHRRLRARLTLRLTGFDGKTAVHSYTVTIKTRS
jgi:PKD repeat protein